MSNRVLLCDDEVYILRAAEIKLRRAGIDVECADDGQEAWEAIQRQCPDLLVTDCQMPRLDGFGLVQKVRSDERFAHLPVLMLTAKGYEIAHAEAAEKWGILAVLAKPFSPRELLTMVTNVLQGNGIADPTAM